MRNLAFGIVTSMLVIVSGCNTQVITGEAAERLRYPYPYGARWVKEGMTRESRQADWVACGGRADLQEERRDWISSQESQEVRRKYLADLDNNSQQLSICIQAKGYVFKYFSRSGLPDECTPQVCLYP